MGPVGPLLMGFLGTCLDGGRPEVFLQFKLSNTETTEQQHLSNRRRRLIPASHIVSAPKVSRFCPFNRMIMICALWCVIVFETVFIYYLLRAMRRQPLAEPEVEPDAQAAPMGQMRI